MVCKKFVFVCIFHSQSGLLIQNLEQKMCLHNHLSLFQIDLTPFLFHFFTQ